MHSKVTTWFIGGEPSTFVQTLSPTFMIASSRWLVDPFIEGLNTCILKMVSSLALLNSLFIQALLSFDPFAEMQV
jgi:hypothetical protein